MILLPKDFSIDIVKLDKRFASIATANYDGITKDGDTFAISWKTTPTNEDLAAIEIYWRNLTEQIYKSPTAEEQTAYLSGKLDAAMMFGKALIVEVAVSNIAMGITQAGKTRAVADYCQKLQYYLSTGSLYAAIEELTAMRNEDRSSMGLEPYITDARLDQYKAKIQSFLG